MGVSGSGKSTLLNWIIGALDPAFEARGELWIGGERRDGLPIEARRIGILFQDDLAPRTSRSGKIWRSRCRPSLRAGARGGG